MEPVFALEVGAKDGMEMVTGEDEGRNRGGGSLYPGKLPMFCRMLLPFFPRAHGPSGRWRRDIITCLEYGVKIGWIANASATMVELFH